MSIPIVDLHCDLLWYLQQGKERQAFQSQSRCSIPQLRAGGVRVQTFAVFTVTEPQSTKKAMAQIACYQELLQNPQSNVTAYANGTFGDSSQLQALLAIENSSGLCAEKEALSLGFKRLETIVSLVGKPLYVSLTWNFENRFGGGALSHAGLKPDGQALLDLLDELKIAVDLSHASDPLAYDIIDYIEKKGLSLPVVASHSNARAIAALPRNLNDELIEEIVRRKGLIGLNFCRKFVGESEESFLQQVAYFLEKGAENSLALGADFFYEDDLPPNWRSPGGDFFPSFSDASCYPKLLQFLQQELRLSRATLEKLSYGNALSFIRPLA